MFKSLFDFKNKKNFKETFCFYLFYVISALIICFVINYIEGCLTRFFWHPAHVGELQVATQVGIKIGVINSMIFEVIVCLFCGILFLKDKNLFKNLIALFLVVVSAVSALFFSVVVGFLPVTLLSLFKSKKSTE